MKTKRIKKHKGKILSIGQVGIGEEGPWIKWWVIDAGDYPTMNPKRLDMFCGYTFRQLFDIAMKDWGKMKAKV